MCYVFVMTYLPHGLKKTSQKKLKIKSSTSVGFSMFGNTHYFWIVFGATMNLNLCTVQGCALVWQTNQRCIFLPASVPYWKSMTPVRDVHSFSPFIHFSPAWKQHHKCLKGKLISSEGFISKQLFPQKAPFPFKKYLNYKRTDERGHFRSTSDELSWVSTEEVHLKW